jgi:hypothetical protein|tara:strand:- start:867 stop:1136 length:270 start_codon:yes stop_codon:yes gene_type:complete
MSNKETILLLAEEGQRVKINDKVVWSGLGNRAGLHSYAKTLLTEKWEKSGPRFTRKIEALEEGVGVSVYRYSNITRSRGKWILARNFVI